MKKITSLTKIISILLIISFYWIGLSAVLETFAYFNDTETSLGNTFTAGTLDFSLSTSTDDFINLTPAEKNWIAKRDITILNKGNLDFWYKVKAEPTNSSSNQCEDFTLTLILENGNTITGSLSSFKTEAIPFSDSTDDLKFRVGVSDGITGTAQCQFHLKFEASQDSTFSFGFSDAEEILNFVKTEKKQNSPSKDIVINEFLPNPKGDNDCSLIGIAGEWVEIYNNGTSPVDLDGWYLTNESDARITISTSTTYTATTTIGGRSSGDEWLVVFLGGCFLDNASDTISLYSSSTLLIDSYAYSTSSGEVPEDKSFARYPDGSEEWYDPIPTPGRPNMLEEKPTLEEENPLIEEEPIVPKPDNKTGGETTEDVIGDTNSEVGESTINDEDTEGSTSDENLEEVPAAEAEPTEEEVTIEEAPADETPTIEEQPATLPDDSSSTSKGAGESDNDGGSSDGGGDISGSLGGGSPAEGGGESSGESGDAGESISE